MLDKALYDAGRSLVRLYTRLMFDLDVVYQSPLPAGPKIIAPNHPTTVDPFVMITLVAEQTHILISDTLFKVPVFGRYLRHSEHVCVVQGNLSAYREAVRLLETGHTVAIFPEGNLSPLDGGLHKARAGAARLALSTGAPVIPVGIHLQAGRIRFMRTEVGGQPEDARWYFHGPYAVTVGEPICYAGSVADRDRVDAVSQNIMQRIACLKYQSALRLNTSLSQIAASITDTVEIPTIGAG